MYLTITLVSFFYFFAFGYVFGQTTKMKEEDTVQLAPSLAKPPPQYGSYILTAMLELPKSDVFEPFAVFFDQRRNRSRVDYQNGAVKTIQFGVDIGNQMYNFATVLSRQQCYVLSGSDDHPIMPQPGMPTNLNSYSYVGETALAGTQVSQWHLIQTDLKSNKLMTYNFYAHSVTGNPIRYEFSNYDTVLKTFVDKQVIEYSFYVEVTPSDEMFQIGEGSNCQELPGFAQAKEMQRRELVDKDNLILVMNPLSEFIPNDPLFADVDFINEKYEHFKRAYKTQYASKTENERRKALFRHNVRFIESLNRAGLSYRLAVNHLADWTAEELKTLRGFKQVEPETSVSEFDKSKYNLRRLDNLPNFVDLWLLGAVTKVGDQKICGSDWAFATTAAIEGANFLKTGRLVKLSEQELVDCSSSAGNQGCDGGSHFESYDWVKKHGFSDEQSYGPYLGSFSTCHFEEAPAASTIKEVVQITSNSTDDLRWAIAANGPVALAVDASHRSFIFYASGIYSEPKCARSHSVDHSLVAVGYGNVAGRDYFLLKNSWSTDWGNSGYMLIDASSDRNCGLLTEPTFVVA